MIQHPNSDSASGLESNSAGNKASAWKTGMVDCVEDDVGAAFRTLFPAQNNDVGALQEGKEDKRSIRKNPRKQQLKTKVSLGPVSPEFSDVEEVEVLRKIIPAASASKDIASGMEEATPSTQPTNSSDCSEGELNNMREKFLPPNDESSCSSQFSDASTISATSETAEFQMSQVPGSSSYSRPRLYPNSAVNGARDPTTGIVGSAEFPPNKSLERKKGRKPKPTTVTEDNAPKMVVPMKKKGRPSYTKLLPPPQPVNKTDFPRLSKWYCEGKPIDKKKPTMEELANQSDIINRVSAGSWNLNHLANHLAGAVDEEQDKVDSLNGLLKKFENRYGENCANPQLIRIQELLKENIKKAEVTRDQLKEAYDKVVMISKHKPRVVEVIQKNVSKPSKRRAHV